MQGMVGLVYFSARASELTVVFGYEKAGGKPRRPFLRSAITNQKKMGKEQQLKKKIMYCIILLGLLLGCSTDGEDSGPQEVEMESLEITVEQDRVLVNETLQMNVKISPTTTTDRNLLWGSTNRTVATVDASGLVTALAPGKTTITVIVEADLRISDVMEIEVQEIP